jgi:hypothetical protein
LIAVKKKSETISTLPFSVISVFSTVIRLNGSIMVDIASQSVDSRQKESNQKFCEEKNDGTWTPVWSTSIQKWVGGGRELLHTHAHTHMSL